MCHFPRESDIAFLLVVRPETLLTIMKWLLSSLQVGKVILKYNFQNTIKLNALYMYKLVVVIIIMRLPKALTKMI